MLECSNITKSYRKKCVVNHLSFHVEKGEVFAFLGSNGAGKTTTIKMILGLTEADSGQIRLTEGVRIGYSPETPYFPPFLTGCEVLAYYAGIQGIPKSERGAQMEKLLDTVGLEETQALLGDPDLLILDEPTAGLDAMGRLEMMRLIEILKGEGRTILINSHILSDIERICDRGIIIKKGVQMGTWNKADHNARGLEEIFLELVGGTNE